MVCCINITGEIMTNLQLPSGENIILSAYAAIKGDDQVDSLDFVREYEHYFETAVKPATGHQGNFERFSLVDPTIRTVIKSTATGI